MPEVEDGLRIRQLIPHHQKHGGEGSQRNQVQHERNSQHAHQQQHTVNNGGEFMGCTRVRIRGRTHHHRRHRQPANSGAHHITHALCTQLTVGVGDAAVHIQAVGCLNRKQSFNRGHNSDRDTGNPHVRVQEPRNIRESRQTNHIAPRLRHRKLNELIIRNCQAAIGGHKYPVHENTHGNRHQRGGQKLNVFQTGDFIPRNQDDEGHNRHQNRPEMKVSEHVQTVFSQLQIAAER